MCRGIITKKKNFTYIRDGARSNHSGERGEDDDDDRLGNNTTMRVDGGNWRVTGNWHLPTKKT